MRKFLFAAWVVAVILVSSGVLAGQAIQIPNDPGPMARQVRSEFLYSWNAYKKYAWGHDELKPLTGSYHDWYGKSLLITPVDALDTMLLMGLNDEAGKTREYIDKNLSFDQDIDVKNFEITIRLLGGLLSSYQLTGDKRLLELADDLGTRLLPAFNSPTGMPYMYVNLKTGKARGAVSNPAEIGTLLLEFGTLSRLTGKPAYYDKAKRALSELYSRRSSLGLVGSTINVETGKWIDTTSTISGGVDSYYEYLLKAWLLFGDKDCRRMWKASIKAVNKYLADNTKTGLWYSQVDMNTGKTVSTRFGALDAFFPAVLARSGDESRARRLQDSAYKMWTTWDVEPDEIDYSTMKLVSPEYPLRPEIMESAYYLYYYTKDDRYNEMASDFLGSLARYCKVDSGYAALRSVETRDKADIMPSYFLAETLKYLYLLFAPRDMLDLDKVVFTTEGHPLRKTWSTKK
ncbi:MAG TPA: glycoside hydrolase family 47 protein [Candidatus Limnocylindrales bacterium]|nr:glycoside hydrolase family 47 protein [Candidatus Limnocylindrales bacterium]